VTIFSCVDFCLNCFYAVVMCAISLFSYAFKLLYMYACILGVNIPPLVGMLFSQPFVCFVSRITKKVRGGFLVNLGKGEFFWKREGLITFWK